LPGVVVGLKDPFGLDDRYLTEPPLSPEIVFEPVTIENAFQPSDPAIRAGNSETFKKINTLFEASHQFIFFEKG
jgi:hypothetical protein